MTGDPRIRVSPAADAAASSPRARTAEPVARWSAIGKKNCPRPGRRPQAVRGERALDLGVGEDAERPRVALDVLLEAEEDVGRGVQAAPRRVVHDHREPGEPDEGGDEVLEASRVRQQAVREDDVEGPVGETGVEKVGGDERRPSRARPLAHARLARGVAAQDRDPVTRLDEHAGRLPVAAADVEDARPGKPASSSSVTRDCTSRKYAPTPPAKRRA